MLEELRKMATATFILFRGSKRISIREGDMDTGKTSQIFQVSEETMFLSDEMFPLPSSDFPLEEMTSRTHFEVNGDGLTAIPTVPQSPGDKGLAPSAARAGGCFLFEARQAATSSGAMPQSPADKGLAPSAARAGGCFLFEARQAATSSGATPQFRRPLTRTFTRAVQLVDEGLVQLWSGATADVISPRDRSGV